MSATSGSGASQPHGVACNSALTFVASAQPVQQTADACIHPTEDMNHADRLIPAGLKALCDACSRLYPDQPNPLQVTTRLKYWLGGQDPLDYISMYWNPGKPEENIPPHWHYISFGLSDLHGDGRVHPQADRVAIAAGALPPSGCGVELTFRLSAESPENPPLWPAALLQALARYVFSTGNKLVAGDHVKWQKLGSGRSRLRQLLVAAEPQLRPVRTPYGVVSFLQIVGCTNRELKAAQRGSGLEVLKLIAEDPNCGGSWLVTRMERRSSALHVTARPQHSSLAELAGVSCQLRWTPWTQTDDEELGPGLSPGVEQQIKDTLQRGLCSMSTDRNREGHMSTDSFEMSSIEKALPKLSGSMQCSLQEDSVEYLSGVHLMLNTEGASLLPLAVQGRILHGAHFTWSDPRGAVTLLAADVDGAFVSPTTPYARRGPWLQVLIPKDLALEMSGQVGPLEGLAWSDSEDEDRPPSSPAPRMLCWPRYKLKITVIEHELTE